MEDFSLNGHADFSSYDCDHSLLTNAIGCVKVLWVSMKNVLVVVESSVLVTLVLCAISVNTHMNTYGSISCTSADQCGKSSCQGEGVVNMQQHRLEGNWSTDMCVICSYMYAKAGSQYDTRPLIALHQCLLQYELPGQTETSILNSITSLCSVTKVWFGTE